MNTTTDTLPTDISDLQALLSAQQKEIEALRARNSFLEEQFRLAQQRQFGKRSEARPEQDDLFNEAEQLVDAQVAAEKETIHYTRSKPKRQPLPLDLPREVIVHDIAEQEKICSCCGGELHKMGEARSEQLEFIPAQVKVIEHVRPKYSCRACERRETQSPIKMAAVPASPLPKSIATPSLLSQIITSKYQYSLPLYRQEALFKQHGIALTRNTMSAWMLKCGELFAPIIERWRTCLLQQPVIHADDQFIGNELGQL